jgi:Haem-binding uptake, Tiki superfamily, ChaN
MQRALLISLALAATPLAGCKSPYVDWERRKLPGEPNRPAYLQAYVNAHYRDLGTCFTTRLSMDRFEGEVSKARVLFLGDHHRDEQLHDKMIGLLNWLLDRGHQLALGLEAVGLGDNADLQDFLAGGIGLAELCSRITKRWPRSWLADGSDVDSVYYRALLNLAKSKSLPVFPLEPTPRLPLADRDSVIARSIRDASRAYPDRLIVVVVGHAHLLGKGRLVSRVNLVSLAVGARMSEPLTRAYLDYPRAQEPCFLKTTSGVLFFHPMTPKGLMLPGPDD